MNINRVYSVVCLRKNKVHCYALKHPYSLSSSHPSLTFLLNYLIPSSPLFVATLPSHPYFFATPPSHPYFFATLPSTLVFASLSNSFLCYASCHSYSSLLCFHLYSLLLPLPSLFFASPPPIFILCYSPSHL